MKSGLKSTRAKSSRELHLGPEDQANCDDEVDAGASGVCTGTEGEEPQEPTLKDLEGILQAYMGQQEVRDVQQKEQAAQQDHRFRTLQHQSLTMCMWTWLAPCLHRGGLHTSS